MFKVSNKITVYTTVYSTGHKGRRKCIQHFIQHRKCSMLNEMLDAFESFQNLEKNKKEEKNHVG